MTTPGISSMSAPPGGSPGPPPQAGEPGGNTPPTAVTARSSGGNNRPALPDSDVFIHDQYPEPLPSGAGTVEFLARNYFMQQSATYTQSALYRSQFPDILPSRVGSTPILLQSKINNQSATYKQPVMMLDQYPEPLENHIREQDLPGGFRRDNIISGRGHPLTDLARGIVQIDDVTVLFDATG